MSNERAIYWITLASQNLRMAGANTNDEKRTRCGHAQETAETALKAAIEAENLNPAWSHGRMI